MARTVARQDGATVSLNVAPPTGTRSVMKNRGLAAAYAGAHRFGVEVFEPATTRVLMAALLVHDLHTGAPAHAHPWEDETYAAAHGGLCRIPYAPRSAHDRCPPRLPRRRKVVRQRSRVVGDLISEYREAAKRAQNGRSAVVSDLAQQLTWVLAGGVGTRYS